MSRKLVTTLGILLIFVMLGIGFYYRVNQMVNPGVITEITENPAGARAQIVMALTFPDGKVLPVNYLQEDGHVYAGADGPWWRAFEAGDVPVTMLIRGETLTGRARVEFDDQAFIDDIFSRLRPTVPGWLPDWANGKLVVIELDTNN